MILYYINIEFFKNIIKRIRKYLHCDRKSQTLSSTNQIREGEVVGMLRMSLCLQLVCPALQHCSVSTDCRAQCWVGSLATCSGQAPTQFLHTCSRHLHWWSDQRTFPKFHSDRRRLLTPTSYFTIN